MRLKRTQNDFRVSELLDDKELLGEGPFTAYRVTKRGLTTFEAADVLAQGAGVKREDVAYAGLKDKDGVTSQVMTVEGGKPVTFRDKAMTIRPIGPARRAVESRDSTGNSFEIMVRDLEADDMRRIRVNLNQVKKVGLPNYFDDQRFGCLRHGQGFVARNLMKGDHEGALRALLAAPSRYGAERVEQFKHGIQKRWGNWEELSDYTRGRRGASVFEHLKANPDDFRGALERGIATRERTIHLFAYQSYLWNRAVALKVQELTDDEDLAWLPCDAGPLPVFRGLATSVQKELAETELPLLGADSDLDEETRRLYAKVFLHEGLPMSAFQELDIAGFRPQAEMRRVLVDPEFLRAAPAEPDEIYRRRQKMRVRFTLPRGHYATMVCKRLLMPTEKDYMALRIWVSRHPLDWPDDDGKVPVVTDHEDRRHYSERGKKRGFRKERRDGDFRKRDDDRRGGYRKRDDDKRGGYRKRDDDRRGGYRKRDDDKRGGNRKRDDDDRRGGYRKRDDDDKRGGYRKRDDDDKRGGYRKRDGDDKRGGYRKSDDDDRRGGYRKRDDDDRRGGYRKRDDDGRRGGYRKRDDDDKRGGYRKKSGPKKKGPPPKRDSPWGRAGGSDDES